MLKNVELDETEETGFAVNQVCYWYDATDEDAPTNKKLCVELVNGRDLILEGSQRLAFLALKNTNGQLFKAEIAAVLKQFPIDPAIK